MAAEQAMADGCPIIPVFPGVVYGPGPMTQGNHVVQLIQDFFHGKIPGVFGKGDQRWNFAFVSDVAEGHLLAAERGTPGRPYFLGGENVSLNEFFALLGDLMGLPAPKRRIPFPILKSIGAFEEMAAVFGRHPKLTRGVVEIYRHDWAYSSDRAREELGYAPRSLEEGMRLTLGWMARHGWLDE